MMRIRTSLPRLQAQGRGRFWKLRPVGVLYIGLVLAVLVVYWPVSGHDFINLDDDVYVTQNPNVQRGFTGSTLAWAFSSTREAYWHPLTLISHVLDYSLFGLNPGGHHAVNLFFHLANVCLLFTILHRSTGRVWPSCLVAALFGLHPLNVESVAWVASRKTVLSTFFGFSALLAYVHFASRPKQSTYLLALGLFSMALMAKPAAIVFPGIMLLLDIWPLGRVPLTQANREDRRIWSQPVVLVKSLKPILLEKTPFILLALGFVLLTVLVAKTNDILVTAEFHPLEMRIGNAALAYLKYPIKMLAPLGLTVFYPFPDAIPLWQCFAAGAIFVGVTILALGVAHHRPYLMVGWFWFAGALLPVTGVIQAGNWPAMADRWAYVPLIGLFILGAWGLSDFCAGFMGRRNIKLGLAIGCLAVLSVITRQQVSHWKNSETLFKHTLDHTTDNFLAHHNLGLAYSVQGRLEEAVKQYRLAETVYPQDNQAPVYSAANLTNLANDLAALGKFEEAMEFYRRAIKLNPGSAKGHNNLGLALLRRGELEKALTHFDAAVGIDPDFIQARRNFALCEKLLQHIDKAAADFQETLQRRPNEISAAQWLSTINVRKGRMHAAVADLVRALSTQPGFRVDEFETDSLSNIRDAKIVYESIAPIFIRLNRNGRETASTAYHIACIKARQKESDSAKFWLTEAVRNGFSEWDLLRSDPDLNMIRDTSTFARLVPGT